MIKTAVQTKGGILELGCGDYSTPHLLAICNVQKRPYMAQASNVEWASRYGDLVDIISWKDWTPPENTYDSEGKWGMVFLDSEESVNDRIKRLPQLADVTNVVVMHDAQIAVHNPDWERCIERYSKVVMFNRYTPWTAVLYV